MGPFSSNLQPRRLPVGTLAILALVLAGCGCGGVLILQGLPHRQVNQTVEVLCAGLGVVMAAGGVIAGINQRLAESGFYTRRPARWGAAAARWLMAMLQLVATAVMILAIYARLLGHALPRF